MPQVSTLGDGRARILDRWASLEGQNVMRRWATQTVQRQAVWLAAVTVLTSGSIAELFAAEVELRAQSSAPSSSLLRLKDVAAIRSVDPVEAASLGEITLGPAPAPGGRRRITFDEIRQRLLTKGVNLTTIEFAGSQTVDVVDTSPRTSSSQANGADVMHAAAKSTTIVTSAVASTRSREPSARERSAVEARLVAAFEQAFVSSDPQSPGLQVTFDVTPELIQQLPVDSAAVLTIAETEVRQGGPQPLTVTWTDGTSSQPRSATVSVWVQPQQRTLAVRHTLPAKAVVQPSDLQWVPHTDTASPPLQLADVVGKEVVTTVKRGEALRASQLADVPLVNTNDIVTLMVRRGGITVRRPFKSQGNAALHETVTLIAVDDPRLRISAVVTGYHQAVPVGEDLTDRPAASGGALVPTAPTAPTGPAVPGSLAVPRAPAVPRAGTSIPSPRAGAGLMPAAHTTNRLVSRGQP
jgi:flagellar basal body P-ring formation protein FlgA